MDKKKFQEKKRKAVEVCLSNTIKVEFLNRNYKLELFQNSLVDRENGLLESGKLISSERSFIFRWDEDAGKIDVDLQPHRTSKRLKNFYGHHTEQISNSPNRKYQFEIEHEDELIFKAIIEVSVKTENRVSRSLQYLIKGETESRNL